MWPDRSLWLLSSPLFLSVPGPSLSHLFPSSQLRREKPSAEQSHQHHWVPVHSITVMSELYCGHAGRALIWQPLWFFLSATHQHRAHNVCVTITCSLATHNFLFSFFSSVFHFKNKILIFSCIQRLEQQMHFRNFFWWSTLLFKVFMFLAEQASMARKKATTSLLSSSLSHAVYILVCSLARMPKYATSE